MSLLFNTRCSNRHLNKWKDMNLFVDIFNALRRFKLWNFSLECPFLNETLRLITTVATVKSILLSFPGISLSSFENYNCDHEFFMFSLVLRRRILITSVFRVGVFTLKTHQIPHYPGEIWKLNNHRSVGFVFEEMWRHRFRMFSVHTRTQSRHFQTPPV